MISSPRSVVREFLAVVRSGAAPERAGEFLAPIVLAHQVTSFRAVTIERSPADYAEHVRDMIVVYGRFEFAVDELLADGDMVYARWTQRGTHLGEVDGVAATGAAITEVASCVYRVERGLIAEYWIQIDHAGLAAQLRA